jgi:predicted TPR repeat methyltransferase
MHKQEALGSGTDLAQLASRFRENDQPAKVDRAVQAGEEGVQANPHASGGDALALRVLVKGGFGGAVLGSRPDRAVLRLDRQGG